MPIPQQAVVFIALGNFITFVYKSIKKKNHYLACPSFILFKDFPARSLEPVKITSSVI